MGEWQHPESLDMARRSMCRIRLEDGREMKAVWGPFPARGAHGEVVRATAWQCEDNKARGLYEVRAFLLIDSLPIGSGPNGECTDAELAADALGIPVDQVPAWLSRTQQENVDG